MDPQTKEEVRKVEALLGEIKENTEAGPAKSFINGLMYGAGIVLGTIVGVMLVGWLLSIAGVIPGLDVIANNLSDILNKRY
jgi:F0F1-type ATP synthase assembly protein I